MATVHLPDLGSSRSAGMRLIAPIAKQAAETAIPTTRSYFCKILSGRHVATMDMQPIPANSTSLKAWRGFVGTSSSLIDRTRTKKTSARTDPSNKARRTNRSPDDRYCARNSCSTLAASNLLGSPISTVLRLFARAAGISVAPRFFSRATDLQTPGCASRAWACRGRSVTLYVGRSHPSRHSIAGM